MVVMFTSIFVFIDISIHTVGNHKDENALSVGSIAITGPYPTVGAGWPLRNPEALQSISMVNNEYFEEHGC